jgi:tetrahydromethanopterin S-methyltransferase subunit C
MRLVQGRLAAISVRASFGAGMWVGAALGLVIGAVLGAVLVWLTGSVLDWQRELGFTLGIARTLLPFGDQIAALRWISTTWWLVIPAVAVASAVVSGLVGGLIGALLAAAYNRSPRHASVVVELPDGDELESEPVGQVADGPDQG